MRAFNVYFAALSGVLIRAMPNPVKPQMSANTTPR
jgi:hypothetical protein